MIIVIVVVTGLFTYYQNSKSEAIMAKFKNLIPPQAKVWRDGVKKSVDASLLVPGDIIEVDGGDKIPADIRILESKDMKVNNSSLTVLSCLVKFRENPNIFPEKENAPRIRFLKLKTWHFSGQIVRRDMVKQ